MQQPMLGHLDPEFHRILDQLVDLLAEVYRRDDGLTIALSASGTSGMEAGIASLVEPGETAIVAAAGFFGNRIVDIARRHGANVIDLRAPYGQAVANERILDELAKHPETAAGRRRARRDVDRRRPSAAGAGRRACAARTRC